MNRYDAELVQHLYEKGWKNERRFDELLAYLEPFAAQDNLLALIELARVSQVNGNERQSEDFLRRAEKLLRADDWDGRVSLWLAFQHGLGYGTLEQNNAKAFAYLVELCEHGNVPAQEILMINYLHGHNGVTQNSDKFLHWAHRAAEAGSPLAQTEIHKYKRRQKSAMSKRPS